MNTSKKTVLFFFSLVLLIIIAVLYIFSSKEALFCILLITSLTALLSFIFSLITNDYSWTDRLWSTLPVGFAWIYAYKANFVSSVLVPTLLITLWGARLTYNFARRGGYSSHEDYRWPILRKRFNNPVLYQIFNLLFIAIYQQLLFILFTSFLHFLPMDSHIKISPFALFSCILFFVFLAIETLADQQQYVFQQSKYGLLPKKEKWKTDYEQGFRTTNLFSRSRHPNYFGEIGVWWSLYFYGSFTTGKLINPSIAGPILLTLLFLGSTVFTESITQNKYPAYEHYKKRASAIIFKFW